MSLSQLSRVSHASLTICDTRWIIDGEPETAWTWTEGEGAITAFPPSNGNPACAVFTRIYNSEHDPMEGKQTHAR